MLARSITKCALANDCSLTRVDPCFRKHATHHRKKIKVTS